MRLINGLLVFSELKFLCFPTDTYMYMLKATGKKKIKPRTIIKRVSRQKHLYCILHATNVTKPTCFKNKITRIQCARIIFRCLHQLFPEVIRTNKNEDDKRKICYF